MNRINRAAVVLGLVALTAVSGEAAELMDPGDEVIKEIVVVNDYVTSVGVYLEDSEGSVRRLGRVARGKVRRFETPANISEGGHFRVRIRPTDPYPRLDHVEIKTKELDVDDDGTVIMWLRTELTESAVEVRAG